MLEITRGRILAFLIHLYTASGLLWAVLTALAVAERDYRSACFWLVIALVIDSTDGFLARRFAVRSELPQIDGRKLDDIVDYLNYTFLPLFMIARAGWIPEPAYAWISIPMATSAFGFCHTGAKEEREGFFRGFPSYWNVVAIYLMFGAKESGTVAVLLLILVLGLFTVLPVRFVYPSHSSHGKGLLVWGGAAWIAGILYLLGEYPDVTGWILWTTAIYPVYYLALSLYLEFRRRRFPGMPV